MKGAICFMLLACAAIDVYYGWTVLAAISSFALGHRVADWSHGL